jgi:hypothetical protein
MGCSNKIMPEITCERLPYAETAGLCDGPHTLPILLNEGGQEPTNHQIVGAMRNAREAMLTDEQIERLQKDHGNKCN